MKLAKYKSQIIVGMLLMAALLWAYSCQIKESEKNKDGRWIISDPPSAPN